MKWLGLVALLAGCNLYVGDDDHHPASSPDASVTADAPPVAPVMPGTCRESVRLYGMDDTTGGVTIGPIDVDAEGVTYCLTLDATDNLVVGHFGASTDREQSATSSFDIALFDADDHLLQAGWDVTFGSSPPTTFGNLEYGVTKGTVLEGKLVIRMKPSCVVAATVSTRLAMDLIEPYE